MSSAATAVRRRIRLPSNLTPMVGREREVAELHALLDTSGRLVTITGPGGIGKTRLALHLALGVEERGDGEMAFVPLAAVRDADLILPSIAQALDLSGQDLPVSEEELLSALRDRDVTLVLDNLEQIAGAAEVLERFLDASPGVTILATSQVPLGITGEQVYPWRHYLCRPPEQTLAEEVRASDAVALFMARARERAPWFTVDDANARTVAEICRRLDGVPLAIELAAARITVLSLPTLLQRLTSSLEVLGDGRADGPDRLRTMRSAIAWSYDLLDERERALFRRLSVFAGGFTSEMAVAISSADARGILRILVHRSLLLRFPNPGGSARYVMLEALRAYGRERLVAHGEEGEATLAFAMVMTEFAESAEPHLVGGEQAVWLRRLDTEVENIRAAVSWALDHGQHELVLRIGSATWRYFSARGFLAECRGWLETALALRGAGDPHQRARALIALGYLCEDLRDLDAARTAFEGARHLAAALGDRRVEARALTGLGTIAHDRGAYDVAMELHAAAVRLSREERDLRGVAIGTGSMAAVRYYQGRLHDAKQYWEESLRIFVEIGDTVTETQVLGNLGAVSSELEDYDAAKRYLLRAQELQRSMNLLTHLPYTLINLGEASRKTGAFAFARQVLDEALVILREAGIGMVQGHALNGLARLELAEGNLREAARAITESMRFVLEADDQHSIIDNAEVMGMICSSCGNHGDAAELLAAAGALRDALAAEPTPPQLRDRTLVEGAAREALGEGSFEAHWSSGRAMDVPMLARRAMTIGRRISQSEREECDIPAVRQEPNMERVARELGLTRREIEVLMLLAQGVSTRGIGEALSVSPRTAATHINNILGKLKVSHRTAAVAIAMRAGLTPDRSV